MSDIIFVVVERNENLVQSTIVLAYTPGPFETQPIDDPIIVMDPIRLRIRKSYRVYNNEGKEETINVPKEDWWDKWEIGKSFELAELIAMGPEDGDGEKQPLLRAV